MVKSRFAVLDSFGNCQRPVFSLAVSQHNNNKLAQIWTKLAIQVLRIIMKEEKKTWLLQMVYFQISKRASNLKSFHILVKNNLFRKTYVTSEGAVSHNIILSTAPNCS